MDFRRPSERIHASSPDNTRLQHIGGINPLLNGTFREYTPEMIPLERLARERKLDVAKLRNGDAANIPDTIPPARVAQFLGVPQETLEQRMVSEGYLRAVTDEAGQLIGIGRRALKNFMQDHTYGVGTQLRYYGELSDLNPSD